MSTFLDDAADPRLWAGYRRHTHARSNGGGLVVLVDGVAQGLTNPDEIEHGEGRWFLICDRHSTLLSGDNQQTLRSHMSAPEGWCESCAVDVLGPAPAGPVR